MYLSHFQKHAVALVLALCASRAHAMMIVMDDSEIAAPQDRAAISDALNALQKDPNDLPAFEIILKTLPQVVDTICITAIYTFKDPLKTQVATAIQNPASIDALAQALTRGSDLAATWACRRITNQAMNADSKAVQTAGGVVGDDAKVKLKTPLLDSLKRKDPACRAAAIQALSRIISRTDLPLILKPLLKDSDPKAQAAAVWSLWNAGNFDAEVEVAIDGFLQSKDSTLLSACCWWWAMRAHGPQGNTHITPQQEAVFIKLAADPDKTVRHDLANAMGDYATPQHPDLAAMLIKMADSDPDDYARSTAVFALRNFRAPAVHEKLLQWSADGQPTMVKESAQRLLKEYNW